MLHFSKNYQHRFIAGIVTIVFSVLCNFNLTAQSISNYKVFFAAGRLANKNILVIRKYEQSGHTFYIGVDPENLETQIIQDKQLLIKPLSWQQILLYYKNTAYIKAIQAAKAQSFLLQNAGIIHGLLKEKGVTLTVDLCPSHKPLDRIIFTSLISEFSKTEKPVPIALSITGRFMLSHSDDINWIKGLIASNQISVTWINHTYNHRYNPREPLDKDFLLEPNTDLNFEILQTEIALLQRGIVFSVFFRFPGLVSSHQLVQSVTGYGLIPIGSDAWLAKGQKVHGGSIILIHGNGNEPIGVHDFIRLLQIEKSQVMKREWLLYGLRESIDNEFQDSIKTH